MMVYFDIIHTLILYCLVPTYLFSKTLKMKSLGSNVQNYNGIIKKWVIYGGFVFLDTSTSYFAHLLCYFWMPYYMVFSVLRLIFVTWILYSEEHQELVFNMFLQLYESSSDDIDAITVVMFEYFQNCTTYLSIVFNMIDKFLPLSSNKSKKSE
jgi:hypothetical protein